MKKIILASSSPRRIELLNNFDIDMEIIPSNIDEYIDENLSPIDNVIELSYKKALNVLTKISYKNPIIIAADTIVYINNKILGKPKNEDEAFLMLKELNGKYHKVYSGICVIDVEKNIFLKDYDETEVYITSMSDDEIRSYIATGEPMDKAGAYAIQGYGSLIVEKINGCYFNVVGLPMFKLNVMLKKIGFNLIEQKKGE